MTTPESSLQLESIGEGWHPLVRQLAADLDALVPGRWQVQQVKEKFGGLRFYAEVYRDHDRSLQAFELIHKAEAASFTICEVCGQPGSRREGGWIRTLCDVHTTRP